MTEPTYTSGGLWRRTRVLFLTGVIAVAFIGYFVGLMAGVPKDPKRTRPGGLRPWAGTTSAPTRAIEALTYADVGAGRLRQPRPSVPWSEQIRTFTETFATEPVTDLETRMEMLELRATRRAFNGAPPTVPHAVSGLNDNSCVACHGKGMRLGEGVARDLPHEHLANCTQCHVAEGPVFLTQAPLSDSSWRGIRAPLMGTRAIEGAPPSIPHTTMMRNNCIVCHGPNGWPGMQTTHPERRNCTQCHAPSADLDQRDHLPDAPTFLPALKIRQP